MIADSTNICFKNIGYKIVITPNLRPLRALFFLFLFFGSARPLRAQAFNVDSLIHWVDTHPRQ